MLGDFFLISAVGFMFDTTAAVARLLFKSILERFPSLPWVIPHMKAAVPYLAGRWEASHARGGLYDALPHPPSYYLERLFFDCLGFQPASLYCAEEVVGQRQFLFGTDYPLLPIHDPAHPASRKYALGPGCQGRRISSERQKNLPQDPIATDPRTQRILRIPNDLFPKAQCRSGNHPGFAGRRGGNSLRPPRNARLCHLGRPPGISPSGMWGFSMKRRPPKWLICMDA